MLDIFSGLRLVVKRRTISIDNAIFRCHWFFTSTLLVSFSLIITARQYVGQPIECHSVSKIPESLLNSYCWVQSTFIVPQACNQQVGFEVPYPCIDNSRGRDVKLFAYYQWVGLVLFIQGLLFHLPYYLWKVWENGLIKAITGGLRVAVLSDQERIKKRDIVVDYIHDHLGCHKRYAFKYFLCEFVCLLNLLAQLWATNKFFDGQFLRYGLEVMQYSSLSLSSQFGLLSSSTSSIQQPYLQKGSNLTSSSSSSNSMSRSIVKSYALNEKQQQQQALVDPMTYVFPRLTKCTYYNFGSSGDIQKHDALCLLPLNIINEKIYIALWFWFLILAILTLLVIIYRMFAILFENVRCKGLISRCKLSKERDIQIICQHCDVGDWFLFYMVAENLDPLIMREIVTSVANKIREHLELKRKLSIDDNDDELKRRESFKILDQYKYRPSKFMCPDDETTLSASSRHNSIQKSRLSDEVPLVKKIKKRLYSKRLWSADLGSGEMRQQLFGQQPATNPDLPGSPTSQIAPVGAARIASGSIAVSAPPISELSSAAPLFLRETNDRQRRASLTRLDSNLSSTSDSFVIEMQAVQSGLQSRLREPITAVGEMESSNILPMMNTELKRRSSVASNRPSLRHRAAYKQHSHHHSITSIRELVVDYDCAQRQQDNQRLLEPS